jgi:hypothetical protein
MDVLEEMSGVRARRVAGSERILTIWSGDSVKKNSHLH